MRPEGLAKIGCERISDALDVGFMPYLTDNAIFLGSGDVNLRGESKIEPKFWGVVFGAKIVSKTANINIQNCRKKGDITLH